VDVLKPSLRPGICLFVLLILSAVPARAEPRQEYGIKAAFLLQFTRFVTWPEPEPTAPFVVGVVGRDPFGPALDAIMKDQKVGDRRIVVKRFPSWEAVAGCDLLYVSDSLARETTDSALAKHRGTLTVSDQPGFCERGGGIRFFLQNQKVRFQVNPAACERAGLKISSHLLRLAQAYHGAR
jgi:hypothetical protein